MLRAIVRSLIPLVLAACTTTGSTSGGTTGAGSVGGGAGLQALRAQALQGYRGEIRPFTEVALQYGPHRDVLLTREISAEGEGRSSRVAFKHRSEARLVGEALSWRIDLLELAHDGNVFRYQQLIVTTDLITDRSGNVRQSALEYPAFRAAGIAVDPGSKQHQIFVQNSQQSTFVFSKEPIRPRNQIAIFSADDPNRKEFETLRQLWELLGLRVDEVADPFSLRAEGLTTIKDRQGLVLSLAGGVRAHDAGNTKLLGYDTVFTTAGYSVVDVDTGLELEGLLYVGYTSAEPGKASSEVQIAVRSASQF